MGQVGERVLGGADIDQALEPFDLARVPDDLLVALGYDQGLERRRIGREQLPGGAPGGRPLGPPVPGEEPGGRSDVIAADDVTDSRYGIDAAAFPAQHVTAATEKSYVVLCMYDSTELHMASTRHQYHSTPAATQAIDMP